MPLDDTIRNMLDTMIARNPLGVLLGFELGDADLDTVEMRLPFRKEIVTMGDLVHGGAIGALIDAAATACAWSGADMARGPRGTTIAYTVNFMQGVRNQDVKATARTLRRGGSVVVVDVQVHTADGAHAAQGLVTYKLSYAS